MSETCVVFVLSGKRKSGKDYVAEKLRDLIGVERSALLRLSGPLKYQYAHEHGLDYQMLLASHGYKERYRDDMIRWGEAKRDVDPDYFCNRACAAGVGSPVWIVSDARRPSDVSYFRSKQCSVILVRIEADDDVRRNRGWKFTTGIDDCDSECALDRGVEWDYRVVNNGGRLDDILNELLERCNDELLNHGGI